MSKFHIKKISEIDQKKLKNFYLKTFKFEKSVQDNYLWRYRMGHNEYEPIVLLIENEICGHAGLIPINIKVNNQIKKSIWFTDFFVDTKYRSLGFGKHLTEQWMKICPTQITLCNEKSLKIFKKFNWSYNNNFLKKIKILNYFNVITGLKYLNNSNFSKKEKTEDFEVKRVENKLIVKLAEKCEFKYLNQSNYIIRDENWFKWRIVDCPYKKDIFILCYKNEYIVVHIFEKGELKR